MSSINKILVDLEKLSQEMASNPYLYSRLKNIIKDGKSLLSNESLSKDEAEQLNLINNDLRERLEGEALTKYLQDFLSWTLKDQRIEELKKLPNFNEFTAALCP